MIQYISLLELVKCLYTVVISMTSNTNVDKIKKSIAYTAQIKRELDYLLEKHEQDQKGSK